MNNDIHKEILESELHSMREQVAALEQDLQTQREIAFASGIFQSDVTIRTLLESLAEGAVVCDANGYIVLINRRAEQIFGYSADEVAGRPLNLLLPERYFETHKAHLAEFFADPRIRSMGQGVDLAGRRKDGTEFPIEVSLSFLETEVGSLGLAFVTDISLRKRAEWSLKLRNQELDAFAHTVAHDLKGSLASIIGYTDVLAENFRMIPDDELEEYLWSLARSSRRMKDVIDELLVFASIRKEDVVLKPVVMDEIVSSVLARLQYDIKEHNAQIVLPNTLHNALGHAIWVEEAWYNYITNAIKYGGDPPVIEIGSRQAGKYVEFWVKDNGVGIKPEEQSLVFKTFVRLENSRFQGHGLGLSVVRKIIKKLDGKVSVASTPGAGSTFSFFLPAEPQTEEANIGSQNSRPAD